MGDAFLALAFIALLALPWVLEMTVTIVPHARSDAGAAAPAREWWQERCASCRFCRVSVEGTSVEPIRWRCAHRGDGDLSPCSMQRHLDLLCGPEARFWQRRVETMPVPQMAVA